MTHPNEYPDSNDVATLELKFHLMGPYKIEISQMPFSLSHSLAKKQTLDPKAGIDGAKGDYLATSHRFLFSSLLLALATFPSLPIIRYTIPMRAEFPSVSRT